MRTKSTLYRFLAILLLSISMIGVNPATSWSADLHQAKAAGLIGERPDGYLGIVKNGPGIAELVQDINQRRRAIYQGVAQKNGISMQKAEKIGGDKFTRDTPPGQYIMTPSGQWVRK